ncbi:MAG: hypothetical protein ACO3GP_06845, partial [Candidatus Limnocylindrus sp.]
MNNHTSQNTHEPLEVELLVSADHRRQRRITVADHERFHRTLDDPQRDDNDIEDLLNEIRDP